MAAARSTAIILTDGNELTSGDVENTNASWLARRLERRGAEVRLVAAVRDDPEDIARFLRRHRPEASRVVVTGGLGGTPDDVTREGVALAFGVPCALDERAAAPLRERFDGEMAEYALRWASLPVGCTPVPNPLGGAPAFTLGNVWVLPGVPAEMRACFAVLEDALEGEPMLQERLRYELAESDIAVALRACATRFPDVSVGSYPSFERGGKQVEVVLKCEDAALLDAATAWLARQIAVLRRAGVGALSGRSTH